MHLVIYPDGRTARHGDLGDTLDITIGHRTDDDRARLSLYDGTFTGPVLPLPCEPLDEPAGRAFTLWVREDSVTHAAHLRNLPATLLAAQWGRKAVLLSGPVVVTSSGSAVSALVEDSRWGYVESLVEDITRAIHGLSPHATVIDRAWPEAIRLAAAVLNEVERPTAPHLSGDAAVEFLMRELGFEGVR